MSSAPRPCTARSALWRGCIVAVALSAATVAGAVGWVQPAPAASHLVTAGSTLTLAGQTSWVRGASGMRLQLRVRSALPVARLGLRFVLYSRLTSRYAFEQSATGNEPETELPVDTPQVVPLSAVDPRASADGTVTVHFPVETAQTPVSSRLASPILDLACGDQCAGVYPLEAVLVDLDNGALLASLTTHLVYTAGTAGTIPLHVSLVLPLGDEPAITASGDPMLTPSRLRDLAGLLTTLQRFPQVPVTVDLYPQLLVALEGDRSRAARSVLGLLDDLLGRGGPAAPVTSDEVLGSTFAPVDVTSLAASGLGGELALQRERGASALGTATRAAPSETFVSVAPLDRAALALLARDGVRRVVLPSTNVTTTAGTPVPTETLTSPFDLVAPSPGTASSGGTTTGASTTAGTAAVPPTVGFAADPGLASDYEDDPDDPELAAHQFLADLAQVYFDAPSDTAARGVVVAPASGRDGTRVLTTVLSALSDSPVLVARTLAESFTGVPVGGNASPPTEQLASEDTSAAHELSTGTVVDARRALGIVATVLPTDRRLLTVLGDAILVGESAGLDRARRRQYVGAPAAGLHVLATMLTISGGRTITLTSHTGKIPITIVSSAPYPLHATIELRDSALQFTGAGSRPAPVTFDQKITARSFKVTARGSGSSHLDVVVVTPTGHVVLLDASFSIYSTAVSGVAVALSIGAVLVLAAWWLRSVLRHRRTAAATRRDESRLSSSP